MNSEAETVTELTEGMGGRWLVVTRDSTHIWDLDAMTYTRHPGANAARMPEDNTPQPITGIGRYPSVGGRSYVEFDPGGLSIEWRVCGRIERIERLTSSSGDG